MDNNEILKKKDEMCMALFGRPFEVICEMLEYINDTYLRYFLQGEEFLEDRPDTFCFATEVHDILKAMKKQSE